jgi:hypothetical protein
VSLSRKRKKELRKLQHQANTLWESQQVLIGQAGEVAREAGRQLGNYNREQVVPTVQHTYEKYAAPYVEQGVATSKKVYNDKVVPTAGALIGSALSVWDAANEKRQDLAAGRGFGSIDLAAIQKKADKYGKKATKQLSVPAEEEPGRRWRHRDPPRRRRRGRSGLRRLADAARRRRAVGGGRPAARPGCLISGR